MDHCPQYGDDAARADQRRDAVDCAPWVYRHARIADVALATYKQYSSPMFVRSVCAVALACVAVACGSSTSGPKNVGTPHIGVAFLAGNQQTDTIQSIPNQALVVQISS